MHGNEHTHPCKHVSVPDQTASLQTLRSKIRGTPDLGLHCFQKLKFFSQHFKGYSVCIIHIKLNLRETTKTDLDPTIFHSNLNKSVYDCVDSDQRNHLKAFV